MQSALLNALAIYGTRPLMLYATQDNPDSYAVAIVLNDNASGEVFFQTVDGGGQGTALLTSQPDMVTLLVDWLYERWR